MKEVPQTCFISALTFFTDWWTSVEKKKIQLYLVVEKGALQTHMSDYIRAH